MSHLSKLASLLLLVGSAACGSPTKPSPPPAVQGQWQGSITSPADGVGTIQLTLAQSDTSVTGTVLLSQPGLPDERGTFTGTIKTTAGAAALTYTTFYDYGDGCTGTYGGSLTIGATTLSGTYVGQNCAHTFTGTLSVQKGQ
jgi:hypothetical protein